MLHILNGDATLNLIKDSTVKGTFLVWKDMLMEGPVSPAKTVPARGAKASGKASAKASTKASLKSAAKSTAAKAPSMSDGVDWKARAAFLNRQYGIDSKKYLAAMKTCLNTLEKAAKGKDEVVFWFEEDFFCQIHLVYLLANLPEALKRKGRATIICPEKPLGVRLPGAFPKLLAGRIAIEPALLTLAKKVWGAYSASSTKGWESFLKWAKSGKSFEPWPLLKSGLRSHLGRLPAADGSLNAMDTALLKSLVSGSQTFPHFLRKVWSEPQVKPLGLGDLQVARYALDLAGREKPLLAIDGPGSAWKPGKPIVFADWKLHLTPQGKARLAAAAKA